MRNEALQRWAPYGKLSVDAMGERLICHECGDDFAFLASHVWQAHGYTAAAYRERFGLPPTLALCATSVSTNKRRAGRELHRRNPAVLRRAQAAARVPEVRQKVVRTVRERIRKGYIVVQSVAPPEFFDGSAQRALAELRADPEWAERERESHRVSRGGRVTVACHRCQAPFEVYRSKVRREARHCPPCRPIALKERASQLHLKDQHLRATDPEYRAKRGAQARAAAAIAADRRRKTHPCKVCGGTVMTASRVTCSPKCRRVIRQETGRATRRVAS